MDGTPIIRYGAGPVPTGRAAVTGRLVRAFDDDCYVIEGAEALAPFLVSVVSDSDHWLFAASNGGLTAGRRDPAHALFPYVTEDKVADAAGLAGPVTSLLVASGGARHLWHPLREPDGLAWRISRRLYKSLVGDRLVFEEENLDLGLRFRSGWRTGDRFGFVRECALENVGAAAVEVAVLDGLVGLLPADVDEALQGGFSCLVDAYKKNERVPGTTLALYTLAAQMVDRAEPRESLHATTCWSLGLPGARVLLSADQAAGFDRGRAAVEAVEVRGRRGAYLLEGEVSLAAGAAATWTVVADVHRSQREVSALAVRLRHPEGLADELRADVEAGRRGLRGIVAATDGLQCTGDPLACAHHLANVLFNDMRGGVFALADAVPGPDLADSIRRANREVARRHDPLLRGLGAVERRGPLLARVAALGDPDLERLVLEYLPLTFSRRHGDPSRPWNRFDIQVKDGSGGRRLAWAGNWRDIFQNWEALSLSQPDFLEQLVAKFVNASTLDGHNPYRIGSDGVDWEVPDPAHPWSTIGYWGDHQLPYLLALLERSRDHHPERLEALLERALFTYCDVPYRLRPYREMRADPRSTIDFDEARHARIRAREREVGTDARLVWGADGVRRVTLVEKLLVPALAKLAAFVPGGGIWMNTQRPEWNDANNALAGYGLSMVTLCHLERYLAFVAGLLAPRAGHATPISREVADWLHATQGVLAAHRGALAAPEVGDGVRERVMAALGEAAAAYRAGAYQRGLSEPVAVPMVALLDLAHVAGAWLRHSIAGARRADGLYHAYNLLAPRGSGAGVGVEHLDEMLEGQVAVLGTGAIGPAEACDLLDALARSRLWRADQRSYLLYPDRRLPSFLEKNVIPEAALASSPALARLLAAGVREVVVRDAEGRVRFGEDLCTAGQCRQALLAARAGGVALDDAAVAEVLEVYEQVFRHRAFTGRSGTMFAYEGLGSIYWHMVGKLLVAVQGRFLAAADAGEAPAVLRRLSDHHRAIRDGLGGVHKSPAGWGAFPTDPYSHSPAGAGARQPGMTGQVKEEILTRAGELGVRVRDGRLAFRPRLLARSELLAAPARFEWVDLEGQPRVLELEADTLAFTWCQVPVVYHLAAASRIAVTERGGRVRDVPGDALDAEDSGAVFRREGSIARLDVDVPLGR